MQPRDVQPQTSRRELYEGLERRKDGLDIDLHLIVVVPFTASRPLSPANCCWSRRVGGLTMSGRLGGMGCGSEEFREVPVRAGVSPA